jgi:hypothetical protein
MLPVAFFPLRGKEEEERGRKLAMMAKHAQQQFNAKLI